MRAADPRGAFVDWKVPPSQKGTPPSLPPSRHREYGAGTLYR
jgi:hypothetical protein